MSAESESVGDLLSNYDLAMHGLRLTVGEIKDWVGNAEDVVRLACLHQFYRLHADSANLAAARTELRLNFAYEFVHGKIIWVSGSLERVQVGDFRELADDMKLYAGTYLKYNPEGQSSVTGQKLKQLADMVPENGEPFVLPPLPWEDQKLISSFKLVKKSK